MAKNTSTHSRLPNATPPKKKSIDQSGDILLGTDSDVDPTLSVVMPTLNEEDGIAECINRIITALETLGIQGEIIVSDSSTDRTPEIAREMGAIVVEPDQKGYGYAYRYAFTEARGEYLAMGDADTTYNFEELPQLYRLVASEEADLAMGSRLKGEILPGAMPPLHQHIGNPLLTKFLNMFYDAGVSDAHSGMRVFSRDAYEQMELQSDGMEFASEMIMAAGARNLTIAEVPITYHPREGEATLESFSDGWRHVRFMLENAPGYLFSGPGIAVVAIGLSALLLGATDIPVPGLGVTLGPRSMIAGSLLVLVGSQIASLGVFATVASNPIKQPTDQITTFLTELQLEQTATIGLGLAGFGVVSAGMYVWAWVSSGLSALPSLGNALLAFTAIVLGLQIVFGSFFLSAVAER